MMALAEIDLAHARIGGDLGRRAPTSTLPCTSTVMRRAKRNTSSMSCSMISTAMSRGSCSITSRMIALSADGTPAAGSSSSSTVGCRPSAMAISTRRCLP